VPCAAPSTKAWISSLPKPSITFSRARRGVPPSTLSDKIVVKRTFFVVMGSVGDGPGSNVAHALLNSQPFAGDGPEDEFLLFKRASAIRSNVQHVS
jgi:hypothetical protein